MKIMLFFRCKCVKALADAAGANDIYHYIQNTQAQYLITAVDMVAGMYLVVNCAREHLLSAWAN